MNSNIMKNKLSPLYLPAILILAIIAIVAPFKLDKQLGCYRFNQYMSEYNIAPEEIAHIEMKRLYWGSPWRFYVVYIDEPEYTYIYDYYMAGPNNIFNKKILPSEVIVKKNNNRISKDEYKILKHPTNSLTNTG